MDILVCDDVIFRTSCLACCWSCGVTGNDGPGVINATSGNPSDNRAIWVNNGGMITCDDGGGGAAAGR